MGIQTVLIFRGMFIINNTTCRSGCYQQRIHPTTLEVGEFCAKMLKLSMHIEAMILLSGKFWAVSLLYNKSA